MRFPWLQFDRDAMERSAALACWIGEDEFRVQGMLLAAWKWACTLGPENAPPDGICTAPNAIRRLAAEMRYRGNLDVLRDGMEATGFLELLVNGIRVRGVSRYRRTWLNNQHRKPKKTAETTASDENRAGSVPVNAGTGAPDAYAYADTEEAFKTAPPPPMYVDVPPKSAVAAAVVLPKNGKTETPPLLALVPPPGPDEAEAQLRGDEAGNFKATGLGWCGYWNARREALGMTSEALNVAEVAQWAQRCFDEVGEERFWNATDAFLSSKWAREAGCPLSWFQRPSVWRIRANETPREVTRRHL